MYAHALIEDPESGKKYDRGDEVPADIPGYDDLVAGGAISDAPYEEVAETSASATITLGDAQYTSHDDGATLVRIDPDAEHVTSSDGATAGDASASAPPAASEEGSS